MWRSPIVVATISLLPAIQRRNRRWLGRKQAEVVRALAELGRDARERGVEFGTEAVHHSDDRNRDPGCNQPVLNRGGATLIFQKRKNFGHCFNPPSVHLPQGTYAEILRTHDAATFGFAENRRRIQK
jgi:hypothetical protein